MPSRLFNKKKQDIKRSNSVVINEKELESSFVKDWQKKGKEDKIDYFRILEDIKKNNQQNQITSL